MLPSDIPGVVPGDSEGEEKEESDAWGWWRKDSSESGNGHYIGLEKGLEVISRTIKDADGIDAVIGFSQGGCAASLVASLLEPSRLSHFSQHGSDGFQYPDSFKELLPLHPHGLKFAVSYSGFAAEHEAYRGFYEPRIGTRFLVVLGSLDSVVEEKRGLALVARVADEKVRVVYHPGGHFVPVGKEFAGVLVGFVRECCVEAVEEVGVEDIDLPF